MTSDDKCFSFPVVQQNYLAQVTSNIWGTKFKIVGLATFLPTNLGAGNQSTTLHAKINPLKGKGKFWSCFFLSLLSHL